MRRKPLQAAVEADSGLPNRAARTEGEITGDADLRRLGLWHGWDQKSLEFRLPLSLVSLENPQQRFETRKKVQPQRAGAHTRGSERSRAIYELRQPRRGRAPAEPGLGDAEVAPAGKSLKLSARPCCTRRTAA